MLDGCQVQALQSRAGLAQSRGSCCSAKACAKRVCRGRGDRGARADVYRGNQNQSGRKPSRGLRRAVRKMPRPAAQQETVFEVNRCQCRCLVSLLHIARAGVAEQAQTIFSNEIKVKFFISISLKDVKARSHRGASKESNSTFMRCAMQGAKEFERRNRAVLAHPWPLGGTCEKASGRPTHGA